MGQPSSGAPTPVCVQTEHVDYTGNGDDLPLYDNGVPSTVQCRAVLSPLSACVEEVKEWLSSSRLRLNTSMT